MVRNYFFISKLLKISSYIGPVTDSLCLRFVNDVTVGYVVHYRTRHLWRKNVQMISNLLGTDFISWSYSQLYFMVIFTAGCIRKRVRYQICSWDLELWGVVTYKCVSGVGYHSFKELLVVCWRQAIIGTNNDHCQCNLGQFWSKHKIDPATKLECRLQNVEHFAQLCMCKQVMVVE